MNKKLSINLITVGDYGVGKTSIINNIYYGQSESPFRDVNAGIHIPQKTVFIEDDQVNIRYYDTCGQEKYRSISQTYYKRADGISMVYDISNQESFENIKQLWMEKVKESGNESVKILLLGNKCDMDETQRQVSYEDGLKYANEQGIQFLEVSSKSGENIDKVFKSLYEGAYQIIKGEELQQDTQKLSYIDKLIGVQNLGNTGQCFC